MNEYFTWEFLGTFAGAVAAVTLIIQFLKWQVDKVWKIPTRFLVYAVSLVLLIVVEIVKSSLTWQSAGLCIINAVLVTMTAMGAYELTFAKIDKNK